MVITLGHLLPSTMNRLFTFLIIKVHIVNKLERKSTGALQLAPMTVFRHTGNRISVTKSEALTSGMEIIIMYAVGYLSCPLGYQLLLEDR